MANMSYCRFQNTATDLDDCQSALEAMTNEPERPLSREELAAAKRLVRTCLNIASLVAETADLEVGDLIDNEDKIDRALDFIQAGAAEDAR
jgi:hypothetical protein